MVKWRLVVLISVPVLMLSEVASQSHTDFSGHWSLVPAPSSGTRRGRVGDRGGGGLTVSIVTGAAFNCGTECTITQNAKTLTVLPAQQDTPEMRKVVLNLDGSESIIIQSLSPPSQYQAHAKWDGDKLIVTRYLAPFTVTQVMSLEDATLKIINTFTGGVPMAPLTLTYMRR